MTPATMTASVLTAPGSLTIEQREVPSPDPGDVLVQVSAVGGVWIRHPLLPTWTDR